MNTITISINAPELVEAMNRLAVALENGSVKPAQVEQLKETLEAEALPAKPVKPKKETKPAEPIAEEKPQPSLEDVRKVLGALSQNGKQVEVKALIASFGATKLTEIDKSQYADLLAKAEAL